jgi:hypothetical protein
MTNPLKQTLQKLIVDTISSAEVKRCMVLFFIVFISRWAKREGPRGVANRRGEQKHIGISHINSR